MTLQAVGPTEIQSPATTITSPAIALAGSVTMGPPGAGGGAGGAEPMVKGAALKAFLSTMIDTLAATSRSVPAGPIATLGQANPAVPLLKAQLDSFLSSTSKVK